MNRKQALVCIRTEYAVHGEMTSAALRMRLDHRIGHAAFQEAARAGLERARALAEAPRLSIDGEPAAPRTCTPEGLLMLASIVVSDPPQRTRSNDWPFIFGACRYTDGTLAAQLRVEAADAAERERLTVVPGTADAARAAALKYARGTYQRDLVEGRHTWSGSSLHGRTKEWGGRYHASRDALAARLDAVGIVVGPNRAEHGRIEILGFRPDALAGGTA